MIQEVEQTDKEKAKMYKKISKKKLIKMLIACNKAIDSLSPTITYSSHAVEPKKCPVCGGTGKVPQGFYDTYKMYETTTSPLPETCRSCNGNGILWN